MTRRRRLSLNEDCEDAAAQRWWRDSLCETESCKEVVAVAYVLFVSLCAGLQGSVCGSVYVWLEVSGGSVVLCSVKELTLLFLSSVLHVYINVTQLSVSYIILIIRIDNI